MIAYGGDAPDDLTVRAAAKSGEFSNVATAADDVALLAPTSGSTGVPKITMHFHRDILSIDNTFGRHALRLAPDDVVACTAPLAFTFGLGMLVVFPLRAGACALLTEQATPAQLAGIVASENVTVLATAPTAYKAMLRDGLEHKLAGLRTAVSAGEHIPQATWERLRDSIGLKVIDGIGTTEMLHIFITAVGDGIRPGATGKPLPGFRAAILGPDGAELGPGEPGRLGVIGPVGCRYLDDARQAELRDERVERHRRRVLPGRRRLLLLPGPQRQHDRVLRLQHRRPRGGGRHRHAPRRPGVRRRGPPGRRARLRRLRLRRAQGRHARRRAAAAKAKEIQDHVKHVVAPYKYPRDVRFTAALPRNASGKLQHFVLREILAKEQAAAEREDNPA